MEPNFDHVFLMRLNDIQNLQVIKHLNSKVKTLIQLIVNIPDTSTFTSILSFVANVNNESS